MPVTSTAAHRRDNAIRSAKDGRLSALCGHLGNLDGFPHLAAHRGQAFKTIAQLERHAFYSNRHIALSYAWSMIFSENRYPLFGIML